MELIEDACGEVTGHPTEERHILILEGLVGWLVVLWVRFGGAWRSFWAPSGVICASGGQLKALT